jgi:hypothetical protein
LYLGGRATTVGFQFVITADGIIIPHQDIGVVDGIVLGMIIIHTMADIGTHGHHGTIEAGITNQFMLIQQTNQTTEIHIVLSVPIEVHILMMNEAHDRNHQLGLQDKPGLLFQTLPIEILRRIE